MIKDKLIYVPLILILIALAYILFDILSTPKAYGCTPAQAAVQAVIMDVCV